MWGCLSDEHISCALVHALRLAGIDVATVQERGLLSADDSLIAQTARQEQRLVVTNDTDFLRMAADVQALRSAPIVFWPRHARRKIRDLVAGILAITSKSDYEE